MGNDPTVQPGARIDADVWERFREEVRNRQGGVRGHLRSELENALLSYVDASDGGDVDDRLRRVENAVERIEEQTGVLVEGEEGKKKKDSNVSAGPRQQKKLATIESRIQREAGDASTVHVSVVNKAIEDAAGTSEPTLRTYKRMLKDRRVAFENPSEESNTWFVDEEVFVNVVESTFAHRNQEIAANYGEEWYDSAVEQYVKTDGGGRRGIR